MHWVRKLAQMKLTRLSSFKSRAARAARDTRKGSDSIPIDLVKSPAVHAATPSPLPRSMKRRNLDRSTFLKKLYRCAGREAAQAPKAVKR